MSIGNEPFKDFETAERLCSWAGVVPRNDKSAGKIYSKNILAGNQHLKPTITQVAWAAVRTRNTPFHYWFWSHQGRMGQKKAIIAISRKILKLIFKLMKDNITYDSTVAMSNIKD